MTWVIATVTPASDRYKSVWLYAELIISSDTGLSKESGLLTFIFQVQVKYVAFVFT